MDTPTVLALIGAVVTILGLVQSYFMARLKAAAEAAAAAAEKVHVAVNSERTAMTNEIRALRAEILTLRTRRR